MKRLFITFMLMIPLTVFGEEAVKNNASEISKHYAAQPSLYQLDNIVKEKISDKITRQYIMGSQSMMAKGHNKPHIKKVLLVVAMDTEAQPIISALHLHKMTQKISDLPMQGYVGKYSNLNILLVTNGVDPVNHVQNVGTQAATLSTYLGIEYFHPALIINIGTAGGVEDNGVRLKEIYVSKKIYFYDRRIALKGYHEYGLGGYESIDLSAIDKKIGLQPGIVCSGDSFDDNQTDYNMLIKLHCSAVDMEAAGVAWVSMLTKIPMVSIKGITNFVKGTDIHEQYQSNLPMVTLALSKKLKELLKYFALR